VSSNGEVAAVTAPHRVRYPPPTMHAVKVSTRGDYASRALLSLALHLDEGGPTSVRDIAERTGLPQPYLEQILLALKGAGLVRSKRGVGGGYVLARAPEDISLSDIVSAVDGPIVAGDFGQPHTDGACDHEGQCVLLAVWADVGEHMRRYLDAATLADIVTMARGEAAWPGDDTATPTVTPPWAGSR
jgi:Rrf2 family protein